VLNSDKQGRLKGVVIDGRFYAKSQVVDAAAGSEKPPAEFT
jgi:hypothetical protein